MMGDRLGGVNLMLGDCLERMAEIADGGVDMILCDLPYGTTNLAWDSIIPFELLWAHYRRVIKRNGAIVLTASQPFTTALISSNMGLFKYCLVWEKTMPTGAMHAKNKPLKAHEDIIVFSSGTTVHASQSENRMNYFPQMDTGKPYTKLRPKGSLADGASQSKRDSHIDFLAVNNGERYPRSVIKFSNGNHGGVHPTQKPIALMEYLIRTYTKEGETVLDNTMGSGTTGVACVNTGRSFIGIERDPAYFAIAKQRIDAAAVQAGLFAEAANV